MSNEEKINELERIQAKLYDEDNNLFEKNNEVRGFYKFN